MTGADLKAAGNGSGWTQRDVAQRIGTARHLRLSPTSLPFVERPPKSFEEALGALGYPGFAYLGKGRRYNPARLLLLALDQEDLPARVLEGLPWLPLAFADLNWEWLLHEAKLHNRQNRLGYIVELSVQAAQRLQKTDTFSMLSNVLAKLDASRLVVEDTLCNASMTEAERQWQRSHRPEMAVHWNLLTHLRLDHLSHVTP